MRIEINNPSGVSDIQRKRLTFLIEKGIISGSAEGIDLLIYEEAQDLIDDLKGSESYCPRRSESRIAPDSQSLGESLSQFEKFNQRNKLEAMK